MRIPAALLTAVLSMLPFGAEAQDAKATLEAASKALGPTSSRSRSRGAASSSRSGRAIRRASRGRSSTCGRFNRVVNYETASLRDDLMRTRALEPPKGGGAVRARRAPAGLRRQRRPRLERDGREHRGRADRAQRPAVPVLVDARTGSSRPRWRIPPACRAARSPSGSRAASGPRRRSTRPTWSSASRPRSRIPSSATCRSR